MEAGISYEQHGAHFTPGTPDSEWLPTVGRSGWLLITLDQRIRYNELERKAILRYRVRAFVFTSGNMSGKQMAKSLSIALPGMKRLCQKTSGAFIASLTKSGAVHIKYG